MRSIVAALILCVGLIVPAVPATAEPRPRVMREAVLDLKSGEGSHSLLRLEQPSMVVMVVQPYAREDPEHRLFLEVGFGPLGTGAQMRREILFSQRDVFLMAEELPAGIYDVVVRTHGPQNAAYYPPDAAGQRASLYIAAEPVP